MPPGDFCIVDNNIIAQIPADIEFILFQGRDFALVGTGVHDQLKVPSHNVLLKIDVMSLQI
jgi:hypothetical protein